MNKFNHIAKVILTGRTTAKISQAAVSEAAGYKNGQFISNVERGYCSIPVKSIDKISEIIGMNSDTIKRAMIEDYKESLNN